MDKPDYKNLQDYEDFKIILNQNGEYRGFRELLTFEELESKLQNCDYLNKAKAIIIDFEISDNISLSTISDIVYNITSSVNNDSEIIFSSNINKTLNDNQIIIKLLASGVSNVTNSVSTL